MPIEFAKKTFQTQLGQHFIIHFGDTAQESTLTEVNSLGAADNSQQTDQPWAMVFQAPAEPWFEQGTYRLQNNVLGEMELFLVPLGPKNGRMHYEAVFT